MNASITEDDYCAVQSVDRRWYMVAVVGTSLSLVSLFCNLLIAKLLWLTRLYWWYVGPLLSLCQVSMTFSCYLIILATIERYLITQRSNCLNKFRRNRGFMALIMFILALLLRGTMVFEIQQANQYDLYSVKEFSPTVLADIGSDVLKLVILMSVIDNAPGHHERRRLVEKNDNCTGLTEYSPGLTDLVNTVWYGTVFRFYIRNIMTVFIPFFLLAFLNYRIVRILRMQQRSAEMFRFLTSDHKTKIRSATRLMVLIVCSYLIANVLNVLINLWEYVAFQSTQTQEAYTIYETCTDVISVLYVLVCATRLFVYISCNKEIRDAMHESLCGESRPSKKHQYCGSRSYESGCRQVGTETDAVAIAIARRLVFSDPSMMGNNMMEQDSPVQAIIYANHFGRNAQLL
uniref:G_PROTEIN_RECEP_F1_2 domain-containing protein n=1 Tax=Heterorhabditis bacteriophora TaxID=37862 RepID=A0A1I7XUK9_HETBA